MIKLLFYQGFSRKKTELLLLFMIKISQISRKGAKQRKEIEKISAILCVSARENRIPKVCCLLSVVCCLPKTQKKTPSFNDVSYILLSYSLVVLPNNRISMQWHCHAACASATA